ncbi:hypothetical protein RB195_007732 [Necator americanus]|uniref:Uncharacterized protein n=1 Tax=Necator americanus TaxID=51031 RepID=A0ABR1C2F2_NECAM
MYVLMTCSKHFSSTVKFFWFSRKRSHLININEKVVDVTKMLDQKFIVRVSMLYDFKQGNNATESLPTLHSSFGLD